MDFTTFLTGQDKCAEKLKHFLQITDINMRQKCVFSSVFSCKIGHKNVLYGFYTAMKSE